MKSPFPGMDPYLEAHWGDVHSSMIIYARDHLRAVLPSSLFARVEERVFLETDHGKSRSLYPDVRVVELGRRDSRRTATATMDIAVEEPILIHFPNDEITETYLEIIDAKSGNRVITVIEFPSPANKAPGQGQKLYLAKQRECQEGNVNLVEIDLLRTGSRTLLVPDDMIPRAARTLYQISVFRACRPLVSEVYPVPLERRLPRIRIPLREQDEDVRLDLQALLDQAYENGSYFHTINYQAPPDPPLPKKESRWARQIIKKANQ